MGGLDAVLKAEVDLRDVPLKLAAQALIQPRGKVAAAR
jgi:hypothetical protein